MSNKILITATVQSHICQFHKPLVEMLHNHGYEVHVAAKCNLKEKNGLKLDFVDKIYDVSFARSPKDVDNYYAYRQLKKIIQDEHYEVVHCNTPMGAIVTRLACKKARKIGTKVYYTAHGFHFYKGAPKKNWILFYPIEKLFSRITDKLVTITYEDYNMASSKFHCKIEHIHGVGVDENSYFPITGDEKNELKVQMGYKKEQKIILCVGELLPNKNQRMAIQMMTEIVKKYPDTQLLLAGNGPERNRLEQQILRLDLYDNIHFLGYTTNLRKYQQITDVLISCSKREGLPINVVEAMFTGNPVVVTKNRGHNELVQDGMNGYLVNINDVKNMSDRILKIFENKKTREILGANARICAKNYGTVNVKQELEKIYF